MLALRSLLIRLKKNVGVFSCDPIPLFLKFLPDSEKINISKKVKQKFDVAVILECSELTRLGNIIIPRKQSKITINIDHHAYQQNWADINWIDSESASISEMLFYIFKFMNILIKKEEAVALYTGIVTDTHNFIQVNTTPQSHLVAAELLELGVEPQEIEKYIYKTKSLNILHLLGIALSRIKVVPSGKIAYTTITNKDFGITKTTAEDTEEIINYAGMIPNVLVWMVFRETDRKNFVKVSFRSVKEIDMNKIAQQFGGGGHKNAAGCTIKGKMEKVINTILPVIEKYLRNLC